MVFLLLHYRCQHKQGRPQKKVGDQAITEVATDKAPGPKTGADAPASESATEKATPSPFSKKKIELIMRL